MSSVSDCRLARFGSLLRLFLRSVRVEIVSSISKSRIPSDSISLKAMKRKREREGCEMWVLVNRVSKSLSSVYL